MTERAGATSGMADSGAQSESGDARRRRASDSLPVDVCMLTAVEEQLRNARRENECLRARNQRLTRAMADVAERGTAAHHLAHHDVLTGLPNRLHLMQRLSECIGDGRQRQRQFALLFIDLDRFKFVNDRLGHTVGDKLLAIVGLRILAAIRSEDLACRYGGDEFVVLLSGIGDAAIAGSVVEKIRDRIDGCYGIDDNAVRISASVGMALYPAHGNHSDALLRHADASMYRSKAERARSFQCESALQ